MESLFSVQAVSVALTLILFALRLEKITQKNCQKNFRTVEDRSIIISYCFPKMLNVFTICLA